MENQSFIISFFNVTVIRRFTQSVVFDEYVIHSNFSYISMHYQMSLQRSRRFGSLGFKFSTTTSDLA